MKALIALSVVVAANVLFLFGRDALAHMILCDAFLAGCCALGWWLGRRDVRRTCRK